MANGFVINTRSINRRMSGVERYTREVVKRLGANTRYASPGRSSHALIGHLWEQLILPRKMRKGEMLWSPANTGPLAVHNQVLTLHDTFVLEHPEWYQPSFAAWYKWILPRLAQSVRRVITVSEHSRRQILKLFGLPDEEVTVIPAGVDLDRFHPADDAEIARVRHQYHLDGEYLLFVGTIEPRKNLHRLVEAWQWAKLDFPRLELVIAGSPASHFAETQLLNREAGLRLLGYIPETDLPTLYSGAKLFILPSRSEGFGLTALEAMACGTPVIASGSGALPETVGTAGILVDPDDPDALADAILELMSDRDCWQGYRCRGLDYAQYFSWQKTADRVRSELENAARDN